MFITVIQLLFLFLREKYWGVAVLKMEEVEKAEEKLGACDFLARARIPKFPPSTTFNFQLHLQLLLSL